MQGIDSEERSWIDDAQKLVKEANERKVFVLLVRRNNDNHCDAVVTNAPDGPTILVMARAMNGFGREEE